MKTIPFHTVVVYGESMSPLAIRPCRGEQEAILYASVVQELLDRSISINIGGSWFDASEVRRVEICHA